ncbi:MAG: antirestriction protein ArdA, partial [Clostridium sp.]|nr:antirestriction protein ArdA [Clostridium sp.]
VRERIHLINYNSVEEFYFDCNLKYPEGRFRFFCWDNIPDSFINERSIAPCFFSLIHRLEELSEEDYEGLCIFLYNYRLNPFSVSSQLIMDHFQASYEGKYDSIVDFAKEFAADNLAITVANSPMFDFAAYANNLMDNRFKMIDMYVFSTEYIQ